ncbi:LptE family protein [Desulfobacula sp.]|uniref:LptE family protein n=1 Tax=Desulfobacula sp. TaxID=2593537 RepID=UPI0026092839|nr:LptE family protein [Desulfobacula sp.]
MKNLKWVLCVYVVVLAFFSSCGYQFEGGGYINNDVTRVAVKVLENKSSETGAGIAFTNALIQEILQKTDTKVVDESRATAVFEGTIKAITFATLSRSTTESVIERRVAATVDLKLTNKDGDVIWSVKDFTSNEEYSVSEDKITDESNKREAVDKIAIRSAEKLISRMMTNF